MPTLDEVRRACIAHGTQLYYGIYDKEGQTVVAIDRALAAQVGEIQASADKPGADVAALAQALVDLGLAASV